MTISASPRYFCRIFRTPKKLRRLFKPYFTRLDFLGGFIGPLKTLGDCLGHCIYLNSLLDFLRILKSCLNFLGVLENSIDVAPKMSPRDIFLLFGTPKKSRRFLGVLYSRLHFLSDFLRVLKSRRMFF